MAADTAPPAGDETTNVAIACQGGGSHTAFTGGVLRALLPNLPHSYSVAGLSGASGGALCATTAWYGLVSEGPERAATLLDALWEDVAATSALERASNAWVRFLQQLQEAGVPFPEVSPYDVPRCEQAQSELRATLERQVDFDEIPQFLDGTEPRLLVSAVCVDDGRFVVFDETTVTADRVIASTAVPTVFPAVEIDGRRYWDGLYSQNPPIRDFLSEVRPRRKPDELWIVRINPMERAEPPTSVHAITDRRNELAGNLSLSQEVRFVEQVNEWIEDGTIDDGRYKPVAVRWIDLDLDLPYSSKLDTDPDFVDGLLREGERAGRAFLDDLPTVPSEPTPAPAED